MEVFFEQKNGPLNRLDPRRTASQSRICNSELAGYQFCQSDRLSLIQFLLESNTISFPAFTLTIIVESPRIIRFRDLFCKAIILQEERDIKCWTHTTLSNSFIALVILMGDLGLLERIKFFKRLHNKYIRQRILPTVYDLVGDFFSSCRIEMKEFLFFLHYLIKLRIVNTAQRQKKSCTSPIFCYFCHFNLL